MSHPHCIDFLHDFIYYSETENILEKIIFVSLSSAECIAVTIAMIMMKHTISDYLRYLAGNTQNVTTYQYDIVETNLQHIEEKKIIHI